MAIMDWGAWSVIAGLSFLSIGGLLIWAYGDSMNPKKMGTPFDGNVNAPRPDFVGVVIYGVVLMIIGLGCLVQGTLFLLH
ncbi:MAG: hypothetical protein EB059_05915 [Alphaproteobacteria bacterium]|nr:hypothetical protein [Alphaproteobacteria bacterium]